MSWNPLNQFPAALFELISLRMLDLSNCGTFRVIPGAIGQLRHLQTSRRTRAVSPPSPSPSPSVRNPRFFLCAATKLPRYLMCPQLCLLCRNRPPGVCPPS